MDLEYEYFTRDSVEVQNPNLKQDNQKVEQLVYCNCGKRYRVWVNGSGAVADSVMQGIFCPHCGTDAINFWMLSGHSAGCFNASIMKKGN